MHIDRIIGQGFRLLPFIFVQKKEGTILRLP